MPGVELPTRLVSRVSLDEALAANELNHLGRSSSKPSYLPRRSFMKLLGVGGAGLALPLTLMRKEAKAIDPNSLLYAWISIFSIISQTWRKGDCLSGTIGLINEFYVENNGNVRFRLLTSVGLKLNFEGYGQYSIPPRTIDIYEYSNVPVDSKGYFNLKAATQVEEKAVKGGELHVR